MSIANIISNNSLEPNNNNTLLFCSGLRCENTCKAGQILAVYESTFLSKLNVLGNLHEYGNLTVDGTLTVGTFAVGNITANNITCQSISGVTGSFSGPVTAASLSAPAVTGTNSNFSGVAVSGSIITSNITMSGGFTAGATGTMLNLKVNNSGNITNNLTVGNIITCNTLNNNIINTTNVNCDGTTNTQVLNASQMVILPDLDTATRDSLPQQEASILYNNETQTPQILANSLWNNISYWPNVASYFLNSDESVPNATIHKIGSSSDLKDIFISGTDYFEHTGNGDFKIKISGIYNFSCSVALQPPASSFNSLQLYLGVANSSLIYYNINGLTDNIGPYHFPNKELKIGVNAQFYVDAGEIVSFYIYQDNDTTNSFTLNTSTYYPYPINYNNIFDVKFVSPKF